jgi:hypothetical protein
MDEASQRLMFPTARARIMTPEKPEADQRRNPPEPLT